MPDPPVTERRSNGCPSCAVLARDVAALRAEFMAHVMWATKGEGLAALKELVNERDRRYEAENIASEKAVERALAAQKELATYVAAASKEAITKAEAAQQGVNERGNEFRQSLQDIGDKQIPREEAKTLFNALDAKTDRVLTEASNGRESLGRELRALIEAIKERVSTLEVVRANVSGRAEQTAEGHGRTQWAIGIGITLVGLMMSAAYLVGQVALKIVK